MMLRHSAALALSVLVLTASCAAPAQTIFSFTGSQSSYTFTQSGFYTLTAVGGDGGGGGSTVGGKGASIEADIFLTAGTTIQIVVGGAGVTDSLNSGGGGGGTF